MDCIFRHLEELNLLHILLVSYLITRFIYCRKPDKILALRDSSAKKCNSSLKVIISLHVFFSKLYINHSIFFFECELCAIYLRYLKRILCRRISVNFIHFLDFLSFLASLLARLQDVTEHVIQKHEKRKAQIALCLTHIPSEASW